MAEKSLNVTSETACRSVPVGGLGVSLQVGGQIGLVCHELVLCGGDDCCCILLLSVVGLGNLKQLLLLDRADLRAYHQV
jgi:hypothetical protein